MATSTRQPTFGGSGRFLLHQVAFDGGTQVVVGGELLRVEGQTSLGAPVARLEPFLQQQEEQKQERQQVPEEERGLSARRIARRTARGTALEQQKLLSPVDNVTNLVLAWHSSKLNRTN